MSETAKEAALLPVRSNAGLGVSTEKCSHGIPMFEKDARCIDCEIKWERMVIEAATESLAKATKRITALEKEKNRKAR